LKSSFIRSFTVLHLSSCDHHGMGQGTRAVTYVTRAALSDGVFPWVSLACGLILITCALALGHALIVV
jgi:hypothetical protein